MSRKSSKVEEENQRLRNELKKLKSEISNLKKASKSINIFPFEEKQKLALQVQEKLDQGIFSPPNLHTRPKSPKASHSRSSSKSPTFKPKPSLFHDANKENLLNFVEKPLSPDFPQPSILKLDKNRVCEPLCSLNDTSRQNIDELQTLERENKMLKELNNLRKENEILRSQIKLKTPKSIVKVRKNHLKGKVSFSGQAEPNVLSYNKSPKPARKTFKNSAQGSVKRVQNSVVSHKHSVSLICKSPAGRKKSRSPSVCSKSNDSFSDNFSFTGSIRKPKVTPDLLDLPRSFDRSPSLTSSRFSSNATPGSKNCSSLLHKGISTGFCNRRYED